MIYAMKIICVSLLLGSVCLSASQGITNCHQGWKYFRGSCYFFGQQLMDWVYAEAFCKAHHSDLVAIESAEENQFISGVIKNITGAYWLGGSDAIAENVWEWAATDEPFDYANWSPHEPNNSGGGEDCLMTNEGYPNGEWNDAKCKDQLKFVCERSGQEIPVIG